MASRSTLPVTDRRATVLARLGIGRSSNETVSDYRTVAVLHPGILGLSTRCSREAIPHLVDVLKDDDWRIRLHAIKALRKIGKEAKAAIPALMDQLSAPHPHVRNAAARTLEDITGNDA